MTTERLGKYEIRGTLGKGAMGTVYAAWDPIISRQVAIKTVRLPDASDIDAQEELARFKREAQAAGRLTHPNIVGIFDYGETDEVAYIVMEFVDGRTLKGVLDGEKRMPVAMVGKIMADLLAGLRYSHDRGVVHRDIKPANVMIVGGEGPGNAQNSGQAKIADFGIARIESSNLTQAGTIMGTPAYMSPEQFMGQTVDARTDIYSSGVLLFQLLTGERPFEGSMATIMHKALNTQPPRPSELSVTAPVALDAVVSRAMARRPDDRFPNAAAFAEAITEALEGRAPAAASALGLGLGDDFDTEQTVVRSAGRPASRPTDTRPAALPTAPGAPPAGKRSRAPLLGGVAVLVLAAVGAGGAWWSGLIGAPEPPNPQLAGSTRTVTPPGPGQTTVVAVAPPSAPDSASPPATPPVTAATGPSTPPTPTPRADVTQVVPPSTSGTATRADASPASAAPPAATQPAQIIPPTLPPPTSPIAVKPQTEPAVPRAALAAGPPLEPARVAPPATATVSAPEPRFPDTRSADPPVRPATRADVTQNTRLEPAVVSPPAAATVTAATVPPTRPERIDPAPVAPATIAPLPVGPVTPFQARTPEPPAARTPTPAQVAVSPETAPPAPTVTAAVVSPEALRRAVSAAVQGADCAAVRGDLTRSGTLSMQGVVGGGAPTQNLLRGVREAAPTAPLDWAVEEVTGPYCDALNLIRAYTRPFGSVSGGIDVALRDGRTNLREDDKIDIRAQVSTFPAYLQVDYFSSDGSVLHVQTAAQGGPAFPARSSQTYVPGAVAPPFGTDLIIAIASSVPLFNKGQALPDEAEPYLRQLHTALEAATRRRAEIAAGAIVVHTSPKS